MRLLLLVVLAPVALAQDVDKPPQWKIVPHEAFEVEAGAPAGNVEALIDELTKLDASRGGLTNTSGGGIALSLTDDAFGRLVRLGPAALPALLAHLDDERPTKLVFSDRPEWVYRLFRNHELPVPPNRAAEAKAILGAFPGASIDWCGGEIEPDAERMKAYTVTVGDCCFAILGQIVNRRYEAVSYQGSPGVAVCSPTLEPRIARAMRAAWGRGDPRTLLAASLLDDFHTRGLGSEYLQARAAARLALYFPARGGALVARRVASFRFDIDEEGILPWTLLREVSKADNPAVREVCVSLLDPKQTGYAIECAVEGLGESPGPEAKGRLWAIFETTDDAGIMLTCLRGPWDGQRMRSSIRRPNKGIVATLMAALTWAEGRGVEGYAHCQGLIEALIDEDPVKGCDVCGQYAEGDRALKLIALGSFRGAAERAGLIAASDRRRLATRLATAGLLRDTEPLGPADGIRIEGFPDRKGRRICDYAAAVFADALEDVEFTNPERIPDRDREIEAIRKALGGR
jgi:hypothetical protein